MEVLVAVEPRLFQLLHAEAAVVAVPVERAHIMKAPPRVGQPLASHRNVEQEVRLTRGLNNHAHLHISQSESK